MRGGEPARRLHERRDHLAPGPLPLLQPPRERHPLDELHGDEEPPLRGPDVVHDDDVRVRELRDGLRLAQQALLREVVLRRHLGEHELERDVAVEAGIVGRVHLAHAAAAHEREHRVPTDRHAGLNCRRLPRARQTPSARLRTGLARRGRRTQERRHRGPLPVGRVQRRGDAPMTARAALQVRGEVPHRRRRQARLGERRHEDLLRTDFRPHRSGDQNSLKRDALTSRFATGRS